MRAMLLSYKGTSGRHREVAVARKQDMWGAGGTGDRL